MVLYATDLVELEKPATKKRASKKQSAAPIEVGVPEVEKPVEKPKAKKTSKKLQEPLLVQEIKEPEPVEAPAKKTRKRKQIEAPKPEEIVPQVAPEPEVTKIDKPKKARKIKPKPEPIPEVEVEESTALAESESTLIENIEPPKKRAKKEPKPKEQDPPEWFKKYIQGVQKEKADSLGQVTKKQEKLINKEALKVAHKSWQSGITRDRVQGEVDGHSNLFLT